MISNEQTAVLKTCQEEQPSSVCDPFVHVNLTLSKEPTKMWIFFFFFLHGLIAVTHKFRVV